jgi:hypothetical protein
VEAVRVLMKATKLATAAVRSPTTGDAVDVITAPAALEATEGATLAAESAEESAPVATAPPLDATDEAALSTELAERSTLDKAEGTTSAAEDTAETTPDATEDAAAAADEPAPGTGLVAPATADDKIGVAVLKKAGQYNQRMHNTEDSEYLDRSNCRRENDNDCTGQAPGNGGG